MRTFKTWRDPYGLGFSTCRPREITIEKGLTVFVGCNGIGKSTLIRNINEILDKEHIPVKFFDNIKESSTCIGEAMYEGNYALASSLMSSSEGEQISARLASLMENMCQFIIEGTFPMTGRLSKLTQTFKSVGGNSDGDESPVNTSNERWILFDATDSGYSIDNVLELKEVFNLMLSDAESKGIDLYILISANEYELAHRCNCFDVARGKYISFKDYDDYKTFILETRNLKDQRYVRSRCRLNNTKWKSNHSDY